jgi:hypothetical protein
MYVKAVEGNLPGRDNMRLVIEAGSIQPCLFISHVTMSADMSINRDL